MITHVQKLKFQTHHAATLVNAANENGRKFYHIIKMDEASMNKLNEDISQKKKVDFKQYGEILFSGWGEEPSKKVLQEIEKMLEE